MLEAEQIMKRCQIGTRNYHEANNLHAECYRIIGKLLAERTEQEPVAWRTFDGEGLYFYCSYEDNETYADVWNKRNPNHKGWVEPLYKDPKPCPTCEALARTVMLDQTSHDTTPPQRTWVGLTDEEITELHHEIKVRLMGTYKTEDIYRAIEAKLKQKNGFAEEKNT